MIDRNGIRRWLGKLTRIFLAMLLASLALGASVPKLSTVIRGMVMPERASRSHYIHVPELPANTAAEYHARIEIREGKLAGTLTTQLPVEAVQNIQAAAARETDDSHAHFIRVRFLPEVNVGTDWLQPIDGVFVIAEGSERGMIRGTIAPFGIGTERRRLNVQPPSTGTIPSLTVIIDADSSVRLLPNRQRPVASLPGFVKFSSASHEGIEVTLVPEPAPKQTTERRSSRVADVVTRPRYWDVIDPLAAAFLLSIPFVLLALLTRLDGIATLSHASWIGAASQLVAVLVIGLGLFRGLLDFQFIARARLKPFLDPDCVSTWWSSGAVASFGVAFLIATWPFLARVSPVLRSGGAGVIPRALLWTLTAGTTIVFVVRVHERCGTSASPWLPYIALAAGLFALAAAFSELSSTAWAVVLAIVTGTATMVVRLADDNLGNVPNAARIALMAVCLVPMIHTILGLLFPRMAFVRRLPLAILTAAVLALQPLPDYRLWWSAAALQPATQFIIVLRVVAAVPLLYILKKLSRGDELQLDAAERSTGMVLALTYFFLPTQQWLYIAVVFVTGLYVLVRWMFPHERVSASPVVDIQQALRNVIRLNEAESALAAMRKELKTKVASGDLSFKEFAFKVDRLEATTADLREELRVSGMPAAAVLSAGPPMRPWERGVVAARYGFLFGIPWIVMYLRNFHTGYAPDEGHEWIAAIASAVQSMAIWPLLGFFFGYFYRHLRGETGLAKGIWLFAAIAAPSFAGTAIALTASPRAWVSFALWALQLFVHCMLIGLIAGDYETVKASKLSWRHLRDVHNMTALTAWGSSILLAGGAAIATTLTTRAGSFLVEAARLVFAERGGP